MDRMIMLTWTLRRELDDQVEELNSVIREAMSDVNGDRRTGQVHCVDIHRDSTATGGARKGLSTYKSEAGA